MKVAVIDDDNLVVLSLKTILESDPEIEVAGTGNDGQDAIRIYEESMPDIVLMDIRMKEVSGIEAGKSILKNYPHAKILYLTTFSDEEYIVEAISIGAKGYLLKQDFESIVPALKAVSMGQSVFGGSIVTKLPEMISNQSRTDYSEYQINEKEIEIIEQVALGLSNKEIAQKLFLSEGTVRNYISVILEKLQLRDRTQLAVFYYRKK